MNTPTNETVQDPDTGHWARPVERLRVSEVPAGAINLNLEGRQVVSPMQGFGQLWQKTYRIRLSGVKATPAEVMQVWRANFARFQPPENHFHPPSDGIRPGDLMFIDATVPALPGTPNILPVASGVMVLYADDESFTVMTPEGFPESGWNTFSVMEEDGVPVVQIQSMARATDPIYEFAFRFLGSSDQQERTWHHVLTAVAAHYQVAGEVKMHKTCLDPKVQWSQAKNIWQNAAIRTFFYHLAAPFRWASRAMQK